jgi:hypothetical protein
MSPSNKRQFLEVLKIEIKKKKEKKKREKLCGFPIDLNDRFRIF